MSTAATQIEAQASEPMGFDEYLHRFGTLTYSFRGVSMLPLLRQETDLMTVVRKDPQQRCRKYDVVLFRLSEDSTRFILHRIIRVEADGYVCRGDNCVSTEHPREDQVIGVMREFHRGPGGLVSNRTVSVEEGWYKAYARFWVNSYPVRHVVNRGYYALRSRAARAYHKVVGK